MKKSLFKVLKIIVATACLCLLVWVYSAGSSELTVAATVEENGDRSLSLAAMLFTLAERHHAQTESRGELWILTTHDYLANTNILKYKEGKDLVVSIPAIDPDRYGADLYASHFNTFNIRTADKMVRSGHMARGRRIYELVARFDPNEAMKLQMKARLSLVDRMLKKEAIPPEESAVLSEYVSLSPIASLAALERTSPVKVTNLLSVTISPDK